MNATQIIQKVINPPTLWLPIASVIGGTAAAASHGNFEVYPAILCLIFAIFGQIAFNITHRYFDEKNGYGENIDDNISAFDKKANPLSYILKEGIKVASVIALTAGLAIMAIAGWWTLIVAALLSFIVFLCNMGKLPLSRSPYYSLITFILYGPIGVISTELVQSRLSTNELFNWWDIEPAIFMSIIMGCMAANCHILYTLYSIKNDRKNSRQTIATKLGKKGVLTLTAINTVIYITIGVYAPFKADIYLWYWYMPIPAISLLISICQMIKIYRGNYNKTLWYTIFNMAFYAIASFIMLMIIGYPNLSGNFRM